LITVS